MPRHLALSGDDVESSARAAVAGLVFCPATDAVDAAIASDHVTRRRRPLIRPLLCNRYAARKRCRL